MRRGNVGWLIYFATDSQEDSTVSDKERMESDPKLLYADVS